jgi:hypothetical protein
MNETPSRPNPFFRIDRNEDLSIWLRSLNVDDDGIDRLQAEEYTKMDILDFITRDQLLNLGIK